MLYLFFQDANSALQESIGDALFLAFMVPQHLNRLRLIPDAMLIEQNQAIHYVPTYNSLDNGYTHIFDFPHNDVQTNDKLFSTKLKMSPHEDTSNDQLRIMFDYAYPNVTDNVKQMKNYKQFKEPSETPSPVINAFDLSLLLRMALTKIPQIPFESIVDVLRWDIFSGDVSMDKANGYFWHLVTSLQGIMPPDAQDRDQVGLFDAGAKFHVADNTPFVR